MADQDHDVPMTAAQACELLAPIGAKLKWNYDFDCYEIVSKEGFCHYYGADDLIRANIVHTIACWS